MEDNNVLLAHNGLYILQNAIKEIEETLRNFREENQKLRTELAAANAKVAELTDDLTEAAQVADADNATVAALVSRIEDEKVTALRQQVAELTDTCNQLAERLYMQEPQ